MGCRREEQARRTTMVRHSWRQQLGAIKCGLIAERLVSTGTAKTQCSTAFTAVLYRCRSFGRTEGLRTVAKSEAPSTV